jgi:predicted DNA-binding transcriptional regulator AlpA
MHNQPLDSGGQRTAATDDARIPALLSLGHIRRHYVPLGERTIFRMIATGAFPPADIRIGGKVRFWKRETVEAWIDAQAREGGR